MKRILAILVLVVLALAACSAEGDDFTVHMDVKKVGDQSVTGEITRIDRDHGWFTLGNTHQIHDNCDCHGFWNNRKTYGTVLDYHGNTISLDDLDDRTCLLIE